MNQPVFPTANVVAPGLFPAVKSSDLKSLHCKFCAEKGEIVDRFVKTCTSKLASKFQTVTGNSMLVHFDDAVACMKCGALNPFAIEEKKEEPKAPKGGTNDQPS